MDSRVLITSLARMNLSSVSPVAVAAREVDGTTFLFVSAFAQRLVQWVRWGGGGSDTVHISI